MSTVVFTPLPESTDERGVSFALADDVLAALRGVRDVHIASARPGATLDGLSGTAGLALSLADWANQGVISGFGLAGLVGAGHGALRWLGYAKTGPKRQEWPFLYTFGRGPNRKEYEKVAQALDRLSA